MHRLSNWIFLNIPEQGTDQDEVGQHRQHQEVDELRSAGVRCYTELRSSLVVPYRERWRASGRVTGLKGAPSLERRRQPNNAEIRRKPGDVCPSSGVERRPSTVPNKALHTRSKRVSSLLQLLSGGRDLSLLAIPSTLLTPPPPPIFYLWTTNSYIFTV